MTGASYLGIDEAGVRISVADEQRVVPADTVVICAGQEPLRTLHEEMRVRGVKAYAIGAEPAAELDAMRAIDQGTRLAYGL